VISSLNASNNGIIHLNQDGVIRSIGFNELGEPTILDYRQLDPGQIQTFISSTKKEYQMANYESHILWDKFESTDGRDILNITQLLHPAQMPPRRSITSPRDNLLPRVTFASKCSQLTCRYPSDCAHTVVVKENGDQEECYTCTVIGNGVGDTFKGFCHRWEPDNALYNGPSTSSLMKYLKSLPVSGGKREEEDGGASKE